MEATAIITGLAFVVQSIFTVAIWYELNLMRRNAK
jgi:hypothetical protein